MNTQEYFSKVKQMKQAVLAEGLLGKWNWLRIFSDKRSEKNNGYRTKFWGMHPGVSAAVAEFLTGKYGEDFEFIASAIYQRIGYVIVKPKKLIEKK